MCTSRGIHNYVAHLLLCTQVYTHAEGVADTLQIVSVFLGYCPSSVQRTLIQLILQQRIHRFTAVTHSCIGDKTRPHLRKDAMYYSLQRATLRVGCNQKEHHSGSDLIGTPITPKEHSSGSDSEGAPLGLGLRLRRSTARALTCEGTTAL